LIVLGGGYVGLELAQAYRRFGSRVSIVEAGPQIAGREYPDVAGAVLEMLHDDGIEVHLGIKGLRVRGRSGQTVSLQMRTPAGDQTVEGSDLLVAAGRTPNTDGIGLDLAGVVLDDRGYIAVNDRLEKARPMSGRLARPPAAHSSPTSRSTISVSSRPI
jgi:pyruvate/2-oxoglutarate dehydrogenase complex dihydrolipoamide dehydrogenase (E3) component